MPDHILRITGDCPLTDKKIVSKIIKEHLIKKNNYTSNTLLPTYPDGMDVEIFDFQTLKIAYKKAKKNYEKEHVTPFIYENSKMFKLMNVNNKLNLSNYRITLDYYEDFILIKKIFEKLKKLNLNINLNNIIKIIQKYDLKKINNIYTRNKSFIDDKQKEK